MRLFRFGTFVLDVQERRLFRGAELLPLTPKAFDTLVFLVERQGHLVEKDELMQAVWGDSHVEEGNLPRTIHVLRRVLGNGQNEPQYIQTVPTKGYRFIAEVTRLDGGTALLESPTAGPLEASERVRPFWSRKRNLTFTGLLFLLFAVSGWRTADQAAAKLHRRMPETDSGAAYMSYQSGRFHLERQYRGDNAEALNDFEAAIKMDPHFAAAYAGKGDAEIYLYWDSRSHDDIARARLAISKALELDPNSSYAHSLLCRIRSTYDWDFAGAETECRRSVELDAINYDARRELAFLLNLIGRRDDALKEMDTAVALAPTSFNKRSRGLLLYYTRRFDDAIAQFKQVETTDQKYSEANTWIARCYEQKRDYAHALEFLIKAQELDGDRREEGRLRRAFASGGWPEVLRASLPKRRAPPPDMVTAEIFAQLGLRDKAFEVLDGMVRDRRVMIVHMDSDPRLDPLRSDPRFEQLAKRVGLR